MKTESKVIIWGLNSEAYKDLVKIATFAECKGFYYIPRIDWNYLNEIYSSNLLVSIPFYDSFLHKNTMNFSRCIPKFVNFNPVLEVSSLGLPFDSIIKNKINEYNESNKYQVMNTHPIYYYKYDDFLAYSVYRCINKRSAMDCPNLEHFSSNEFCFESYLNYGNR